jgi:two-component system response regulator RegX3
MLCEIENVLKQKNDILINSINTISNIVFPKLVIYEDNHVVISNGIKKHFTDQQFRILLCLARNPGRVFTYEQIYEAVWGEEYLREKGNIMSQIRHIREKIEPDESFPHYIENVRGVGYRFSNNLNDER